MNNTNPLIKKLHGVPEIPIQNYFVALHEPVGQFSCKMYQMKQKLCNLWCSSVALIDFVLTIVWCFKVLCILPPLELVKNLNIPQICETHPLEVAFNTESKKMISDFR